jgi:type VI secretion system protein ImpB
MAKENSQKSIGRMRPPRVQIEYDVEVNGSEKKVNLPFVMGVMSDLSGQSLEELPPIAARKFLEIDSENFDARMAAIKPRVAMSVPNALTGEGNLGVDITFESMDDFSPAAIARKVEPLRRLLEARSQLSNLMTYMDGKVAAEDMVSRLLSDPALLQTLAQASAPSGVPQGGEGDAGAPDTQAADQPGDAAPQS